MVREAEAMAIVNGGRAPRNDRMRIAISEVAVAAWKLITGERRRSWWSGELKRWAMTWK